MPLILGTIAWVSHRSAGGTVLLNTAICRQSRLILSNFCKFWIGIRQHVRKVVKSEFRLLDIIRLYTSPRVLVALQKMTIATELVIPTDFQPAQGFPSPILPFQMKKWYKKKHMFFHPWGFWAPRINFVTCCTVLPCWSRPVLRCGPGGRDK